MAEAAAMEWGLQVALRAGVTAGIFKFDSLEVVELVNKKTNNMAEIFWLISKILKKARISRTSKLSTSLGIVMT